MNEKTVWESYTEEDRKKVYDFCEEYRTFLSKCKTERECVKEILKEAEAKGYRSLKEVRRSGEKLQAGDKVYVSIMGKTLALFHIGKEPMEKGMNILGAHIDSPRLDLKQNPLYESDGLAMLETKNISGLRCRWHCTVLWQKKTEQAWRLHWVKIHPIRLSAFPICFRILAKNRWKNVAMKW